MLSTSAHIRNSLNTLYLQGLQFMHKHHVAHRYVPVFYTYYPIINTLCRDISELNVMMDGSMYPNGWHPRDEEMDRFDPSIPAKHYTRSERPPKYYLIDFGLSRRYDPNSGPPLEPIIHGGDKSVPEFQNSNAPCNPFPTDIYYLGNLFRQEVLQVGYIIFTPSIRRLTLTRRSTKGSDSCKAWWRIWFRMIRRSVPPSTRSLPVSRLFVTSWGPSSFGHALVVEKSILDCFVISHISSQVPDTLCKASLPFPLVEVLHSLCLNLQIMS